MKKGEPLIFKSSSFFISSYSFAQPLLSVLENDEPLTMKAPPFKYFPTVRTSSKAPLSSSTPGEENGSRGEMTIEEGRGNLFLANRR